MKKVLWYINTVSSKLQGGGAYNKTYICEITTYFCSLTVIENIMHHKMLGGCNVFYFYFYFPLHSKIFSGKSVNHLIKKKRLNLLFTSYKNLSARA